MQHKESTNNLDHDLTLGDLSLGIILTAIMLITRSHHLASIHHLPDASWAIFFLAGFYFKDSLVLFSMCAIAILVDYVAITWGGVSSFCISSAYLLLLPTYALLWASGRGYAYLHKDSWSTLPLLAVIVIIATLGAELVSSASFYFLSGRFTTPNWVNFQPRLLEYFPYSLSNMALYISTAAMVHGLFIWHYPKPIAIQSSI